MSATVTTMPGVTIQSAVPRANVIELIEELLAEARSGKIQTFGAVMVDAAGVVATAFSTSAQPHAHHLVAGSIYLLRRAEKNAGLED